MADKYLPAFPHTIEHLHEPITTGMTLRDYFAAHILQGFLHDASYSDRKWAATKAYSFADAMLEARES
jgi:hypothetical protein